MRPALRGGCQTVRAHGWCNLVTCRWGGRLDATKAPLIYAHLAHQEWKEGLEFGS